MKTSDHRKPPDGLARRLLPWLAALALGLASVGAAAQGDSGAADKTAQKQRAIHELIRLSDAAQLKDIFTQRFISRIVNAAAVFRPDMDAHTLAVIASQARAVIQEHIASGDALYSVLYPVYEKHFNLIELNELLKFYHSPVGQKLVRISPELLSESLSLGRRWALSLVPEILQRVQARLNADNTGAGHAR